MFGLRLGGMGLIPRRSGASWTPLTLFLAGEQGGWYDPADLTTMFQDSAGTTPVTAVEQPVGLWLDKRLGALSALGTDRVTNGDFDNGTTGWTPGANAPLTVEASFNGRTNVGRIVNNGASGLTTGQFITGLTAGRSYQFSAWVYAPSSNTQVNAASIYPSELISARRSVTAEDVWQLVTGIFVAAGSSTTLNINAVTSSALASVGDVAYFDNISVREVPGNHLIQPTAPNRPVYSKRYNQLVSTENLASASWANTVGGTGTTPVRTAAYAAAPNGTMTATRLQVSLGGGTTTAAQSYVSQIYAITVDHTYRIWLKSNTASSYVVYVRGSNTEAAVTVTPEWQQFTVSVPSSSSNVWAVGLRGGQATPNSDSADILVWGTDARRTIHTTMGMPAYQRVTTATDYDETGFLPRVAFNGASSSMYSAASIDFSASDHMTVLSGITKLSDLNLGLLAEFSPNFNSNNGSFYIAAPELTGASGNFSANLRGSTAPASAITSGTDTAPVTRVLSVLSEIDPSLRTMRVNSVQTAQSSQSQGAGNFGNHVLFVGRRNNASLPFNGDIFQLILRGALTSGADLTSAEQYVAARTGVTLP